MTIAPTSGCARGIPICAASALTSANPAAPATIDRSVALECRIGGDGEGTTCTGIDEPRHALSRAARLAETIADPLCNEWSLFGRRRSTVSPLSFPEPAA